MREYQMPKKNKKQLPLKPTTFILKTWPYCWSEYKSRWILKLPPALFGWHNRLRPKHKRIKRVPLGYKGRGWGG